MMAALTPQQIAYQTAHIDDDRRPDVLATGITMALVATTAVTVRFICRRHMKVAISYDDYFILLALVCWTLDRGNRVC